MLKLKRVDIQGFKSFCDRTELRFNGGGIAAVVGPNGCGKSNLSDAISWVLGEQCAKSLRGARMEDVIFAGTRDRKPLGMAQVTMTLVDPARRHEAPVRTAMEMATQRHDGHQQTRKTITITRRLFRSGESEYLIDGRPARLRDIQDIFMGTGLGPESYAIIEQGRIGQILSSKPQDRRAVIEEAAGITQIQNPQAPGRSQARKRASRTSRACSTSSKKSPARPIRSSARHPRRSRYEELRTEMIAHLRRAVSGRFQMLEREAARLALDLNQAQTAFQTLSPTVQEREQEHTRLQESAYQTEASLTASRSQVAALNLESERTRGRLELQAKQIAAYRGSPRVRRMRKIRILPIATSASRPSSKSTKPSSPGLKAKVPRKTRNLTQKRQNATLCKTHLRERERSIEQARQQVLRLLGEASTLRNQLAQIDEYLAGDRARRGARAQGRRIRVRRSGAPGTGQRASFL